MWNSQPNPYQNPNQQQANQKHDIFVGNLAFSTTEEQLHQAFSELGRIIKIRMVTDLETGKPRGFAFVEFEKAQDALSAIRNMNEYELNGRKIRVNFSNSSHLETLAGQLGMDMTQKTKNIAPISGGAGGSGAGGDGMAASGGTTVGGKGNASSSETGTQAVANALKSMSKGEMYDIIAKLKEIADSDPDEARKIISGHPQLPEAILYLMSQLDMMKTAVNTSVMGVGGAAPPAPVVTAPPPPILDHSAAPPPPRIDPRTDPRTAATAAAVAAPVPPPPVPSDPRDPRNRASDPRRQQAAASGIPTAGGALPPPPMQQQYMPPPPGVVPQHAAPPPPPMGVAGLDPSLVQQVMGLTPAQIAQLPADKQTSILALRQQIQSAMGGTA